MASAPTPGLAATWGCWNDPPHLSGAHIVLPVDVMLGSVTAWYHGSSGKVVPTANHCNICWRHTLQVHIGSVLEYDNTGHSRLWRLHRCAMVFRLWPMRWCTLCCDGVPNITLPCSSRHVLTTVCAPQPKTLQRRSGRHSSCSCPSPCRRSSLAASR